jgi:hypothetical protein
LIWQPTPGDGAVSGRDRQGHQRPSPTSGLDVLASAVEAARGADVGRTDAARGADRIGSGVTMEANR